MKKVISILLGVFLFCTLTLGASVPTMAESKYIPISNYDELKLAIEKAKKNSVLNLKLGKDDIYFNKGEIVIDKPITINFKTDSSYAQLSGVGHRIFKIVEDHVHINFQSKIYIFGCESEDEGGAIYIDGEDVSITGGIFQLCKSKDNGGAIFVADDDVTIKKAQFDDCHADKYGGAISLHSGAYYDLVVSECHFYNCNAGKKGQWVDGSDDTTIVRCTGGPYSEKNYYECEFDDSLNTGSVLSNGKVWIMVGVGAVAVVAIVILVIAKKKKRKLANTEALTIDEDE